MLSCALVLFALMPDATSLTGLPVGDRAPEIILRDVAGSEVTPTAAEDSLLLLFFVNNKQVFTARAIESLEGLLSDLPAEHRERLSVRAVRVGAVADPPDVSLPKDWVVLFDAKREAASKCGVIAYPTTIILDSDRTVIEYVASYPPDYRTRLETAVRLHLGLIDRAEYERRRQRGGLSGTEGANKNKALLHVTLARKLAASGSLEKAESSFRRGLEIAPEDPNVVLPFVGFLLDHDRFEEAGPFLEVILGEHPAHTIARFYRARTLVARGSDSEAEKLLRELLPLVPDKSVVLLELGGILERRGEWQEAAGCYRQALELLLARRTVEELRPSRN